MEVVEIVAALVERKGFDLGTVVVDLVADIEVVGTAAVLVAGTVVADHYLVHHHC